MLTLYMMLTISNFLSVSSIPPRGGSNMNHRTIPASRKPIYLSCQLKGLRGACFASVNIHSVVTKHDDIMVLLNNSELDYLGLTESWLNASTSDNELSVDGYSMLRCDRRPVLEKGGGGILVYMRKHHCFKGIESWNLICQDVEWVWSLLSFKHMRPTYICTLYRPPSGSIPAFQQLLESKVLDLYADGMVDILILCDANIDVSKKTSPAAKSFLNFLSNLGLSQMIKDPTRVTQNTQSLINHCITNKKISIILQALLI